MRCKWRFIRGQREVLMLIKTVKISRKYQSVIPSFVRTRLQLNALDYINFVEDENGRIYIEKSIMNFNENGFDFISLAQTLLSPGIPLILISDGNDNESQNLFKKLLIDSLSDNQTAQLNVVEKIKTTEFIESFKDKAKYTVVLADSTIHYDEISKKYDCILINFKEGRVQSILKLDHSNNATHTIYNRDFEGK